MVGEVLLKPVGAVSSARTQVENDEQRAAAVKEVKPDREPEGSKLPARAPVEQKDDAANARHGRRQEVGAKEEPDVGPKVKFKSPSESEPGDPPFEADGVSSIAAPRVAAEVETAEAPEDAEPLRRYDAQGREAPEVEERVGEQVNILA